MGQARLPFATPVYIRCVVDCLNSLGVRPPIVLSSAGLAWQDLCDGQHMVDFGIFRRFIADAIRCSGAPDLGLLAGSMLQPYHTPVGVGAVTSENLGQALRFLSRHARLIFGSLSFELETGPRASCLKVRPHFPLFETHAFVAQTIVGAHCRLLEAILGRHVDELRVGLPYARPAGDELTFVRHVRQVRFDQPCLSLELPAELLRAPCIAADAKAHSSAALVCLRQESEVLQGAFEHRVRNTLLECLTANPDTGAVAAAMGVSAKALVRKLSEVGMTYSEIKNDLRRTQAAWYLQHTELSIEDIASQLGYAEPSNFARKFKHWYRVAPSKMRQAMRAAAR